MSKRASSEHASEYVLEPAQQWHTLVALAKRVFKYESDIEAETSCECMACLRLKSMRRCLEWRLLETACTIGASTRAGVVEACVGLCIRACVGAACVVGALVGALHLRLAHVGLYLCIPVV